MFTYVAPKCSSPPRVYLTLIDVPDNLNEGAKAKYSCVGRYKLVGDDTLKCVAGKWVGNVPHCQGMLNIIYIVLIMCDALNTPTLPSLLFEILFI